MVKTDIQAVQPAGAEGDMQTRDDLVELARACLKQARESKNPVVVAELTHLAKGYQIRAAAMDNGKLPDIGEQAAPDRGPVNFDS
jgi:hypothetical protein